MLENVSAAEAKKPATLFVATPMYGGMCVGGYTMGILNCTQEFMKHGHGSLGIKRSARNCLSICKAWATQ